MLFPGASGGTTAGFQYPLTAANSSYVIIPLDINEIKEHLQKSVESTDKIFWIEDNNLGIRIERGNATDQWGMAGQPPSPPFEYVSTADGIRIYGFDTTSGKFDVSTSQNFDDGTTAESRPRSICTVLHIGGTSTINFYSTKASDIIDSSGSLTATTNAASVKTWMAKDSSPKPVVSIIYEWKK
jgi:hypothetical protein